MQPGWCSSIYSQLCPKRAGTDSDQEACHVADTYLLASFIIRSKRLKMVHEGPQVIQDLIDRGMIFDQAADGRLDLGFEGAHTHKRILHAGGSNRLSID